jgi:hypothetical protein
VLGKAISEALNATTEAAARLNATSQALRAVEQEKTSELLSMITQLAKEEEEEERQETAKQAYEQHTSGRKESMGGNMAAHAGTMQQQQQQQQPGAQAGSSGAFAGQADGGEGQPAVSGNGTAFVRPREQVREVLKQAAAAASNGSAVNVTQMAQAAMEAASTVLATSKASVEQTIEKKRSKVDFNQLVALCKPLFAALLRRCWVG